MDNDDILRVLLAGGLVGILLGLILGFVLMDASHHVLDVSKWHCTDWQIIKFKPECHVYSLTGVIQ